MGLDEYPWRTLRACNPHENPCLPAAWGHRRALGWRGGERLGVGQNARPTIATDESFARRRHPALSGRWKRRAALGPWATGFAGYHVDVAYFIKERGVSFIAADGPNDVSPSGLPLGVGLRRVPVHGRAAPRREGHGIALNPLAIF